ncbi:MAG: DUF4755 domain-containing protein [Limnobacter sp.]|uniref:DUF4755 domain-containing protein n=1 Tax=Limnobacter sp. TaxID=2003368 RepID=UPI00391D4DC2
MTSRNKSFLAKHKDCEFKHAFNDSGMAIDTKNRLVSIFKGKNEVTYSFSDVREWSFNCEFAGKIHGGGFHVATANVKNIKSAKERTGFFIKVRDIDNPKWRVEFKYQKKMQTQLERWMEIFNQTLNEDRA